MKRNLAAIVATLALVTPFCPAAELHVTGPEIALLIQNAFSGTVIRLHTFPPDPSAAHSFVQLPPGLGGQRVNFALAPHDLSLGLGAEARFVIDDVNSNAAFLIDGKPMGQNIGVVASANGFVLNIRFEDQGTEIRGLPAGRVGKLSDGTIPDVQINGIRLQVNLFPVAAPAGKGIAFRPAQVIFHGDIQAGGLAGVSILGRKFDLFDHMTDYKREIKTAIEREVAALINRNLPAVATNVWKEANRRALASGVQIRGVRFAGTTLIITLGMS